MQFPLCISSTSAFLFNQIPDDKQGEEKELFYVVGRGATKEATRGEACAVDLIDGEELCELLKKLQLGVETLMIEKVVIEPEWFTNI